MNESEAKAIFDYFNANSKNEIYKNRGFLKYSYLENSKRLYIEFSYYSVGLETNEFYWDVLSFNHAEINYIQDKIKESEQNLLKGKK